MYGTQPSMGLGVVLYRSGTTTLKGLRWGAVRVWYHQIVVVTALPGVREGGRPCTPSSGA